MQKHYFNALAAKELGINESIIVEHLIFWIGKNQKSEKNFYDGRTWMFDSYTAFAKRITYMSERQIGRVLCSLEAKGIILSANYNKMKYDRTKWYAFTDFGCSKIHEWYGEDLIRVDPISSNVEPIPVSITDRDVNNNTQITNVLAKLNQKTGSEFCVDKNTKDLIDARLADGYTEEDFYCVIEKMTILWDNDSMRPNLRPSVLFGAKMGEYLALNANKEVGATSFDIYDFFDSAVQRTYRNQKKTK